MLDQESGLASALRDPRAANQLRWLAAALALAAVLLGIGFGRASAAPPVGRQIDATQAIGCCVCRGTAGGEQRSLKSCADGKTVGDCLIMCRGESAGSMGFGYQQTCSQGCAGFPTQNK